MSTLRKWLNNADFDWENGTIIYQPANGYSPGWSSGDELSLPRIIANSDPILDHEFESGHGAPWAPRIFARDSRAVYFPGQYDGATWLESVIIDPEHYLAGNETPYPGG
jgi:hypothetical protein